MKEEFIIRRGVFADVKEIAEVMELTQRTMENPEWFVADDYSWIESHIEKQGFTMVAEIKTEQGLKEIAAFFIIAFPDMDKKNLGKEIHLTAGQLALVAHMDSVCVRPQYRGNHLQGRLLEAAERELLCFPHQYFLCTVHPDNHASLGTMLSHGYVIVATKDSYYGRIRHILYKKKEQKSFRKPNILVSACLLGVHCRYNEKGVVEDKVPVWMDQANLIPVCPELLGGLPTPREPAERVGEQVITVNGKDVTREYKRGAEETLALAKLFGCRCAVLKERSPSCGNGFIYDGTHSGRLTEGDGVTAELLKNNGILVFGESEAEHNIMVFLENENKM
ncbi:MAG: GNAT family N-acetyltransferase [Lachnospiraceae bacterium]|jgi:uncharacterized protein YbbK (DUF523 family)/ribosomal protein S18 acetylase RimI-like enzyme|nr:GNAT family N-acetyltransferase [Lachnospiraceae bacterium]